MNTYNEKKELKSKIDDVCFYVDCLSYALFAITMILFYRQGFVLGLVVTVAWFFLKSFTSGEEVKPDYMLFIVFINFLAIYRYIENFSSTILTDFSSFLSITAFFFWIYSRRLVKLSNY